MESRVLSRATTVTTISSLRRSPRESQHNVSFVSLKPVGAVGEGGNVIWGRQLRPALLLESSNAPDGLFAGKREILRPTLATASSPAEGSDSAGWGPSPPFWLGHLAFANSVLISVFFFSSGLVVIAEKLLRSDSLTSIRLSWPGSFSSCGKSRDLFNRSNCLIVCKSESSVNLRWGDYGTVLFAGTSWTWYSTFLTRRFTITSPILSEFASFGSHFIVLLGLRCEVCSSFSILCTKGFFCVQFCVSHSFVGWGALLFGELGCGPS